MCGLFGLYSSTITTHEKSMFTELGYISALRGIDSTGMIVGTRKKKNGTKTKITPYKEVMTPIDFFENWKVKKAIAEDNVFLLAGHARATTAGATNFHNAHPIQEGNITLCHNGTINKWKPGKQDENTSSDSRIFAKKISQLGVYPALREAEVGDYAVTFVDANKKTFNIARKTGRTLYVIFSKDGEVMMWASEAEFLSLVLMRNGVRHNWGKIELFPSHTHYEWKFTDRPDKGNSTPVFEKQVIDLTKYATKVEKTEEDEPTHDDRAAYDAWMEARAKKEHDWVPYTYGDPAFEQEDENDPPAETLSRETSSEDRAQLAEGPKQVGEADQTVIAGNLERYYCKKCFERTSGCECESPQLYLPPVWELDSKGRHIRRKEAKETSVPQVGKLVVTRAEHDAKLEKYLTDWNVNRGNDEHDTYVGFLRSTMSPSVATEKLKAGCGICGGQSDWKSTVYWYSDWGHVCFECKDKTHDYIGPVTTYKSRYTEGEVSNVTKH